MMERQARPGPCTTCPQVEGARTGLLLLATTFIGFDGYREVKKPARMELPKQPINHKYCSLEFKPLGVKKSTADMLKGPLSPSSRRRELRINAHTYLKQIVK